jgi:hypothetical protein
MFEILDDANTNKEIASSSTKRTIRPDFLQKR